jgi:K+-sensing histidine kinase KdpD
MLDELDMMNGMIGSILSFARDDATQEARPTAMRRAICNLVDNAVKCGSKADVTPAPEAGRIVILVEDEGPGIPRSEREKVFEPFYRIGSARDPSTGGVGLGLPVTRSIVWEHDGDITLGARKGGGLSVGVELPNGLLRSASRHQELAESPIQPGTGD